MADIAGFGGGINFSGTANANITEWSASLDLDTITIPASFGESYEGATIGAGRITGSLSGTLDTAKKPFGTVATNAPWGTALTGTLYLNATGGTATNSTNAIVIPGAIITNVKIGRPHNGVATFSADFHNGTSEPTISWS